MLPARAALGTAPTRAAAGGSGAACARARRRVSGGGAAVLTSARRGRPSSARRPAGLAPPRAEADYPPSRLGTTIGVGLAMQINAAVFAAAYETLPSLQLIASRLEEVEPRWAHACMVKFGTLLASPIDLLLLTIALSLIELMRLMAGGDDE